MSGRRWDNDERGDGIADARAFAPGIEALLEGARRPNWVAEEPELHLLPHLRLACESLPLELVGIHTADDGSFDVELRWEDDGPSIGAVRAAVFSLVGSFAEPSTFVRQRAAASQAEGDSLDFEIVTGFLEGQSRFTPHGHTVRVRVIGVG
jgi:hypothetical protein